MMKKMTIFLFALISMTIAFSSCEDDCPSRFTPLIPSFTFSPQQDSFRIGDTIWVSADFHHTITDIETGEKVTFRDFDFSTNIDFSKIDMNPFGQADTMFGRFEVKGKLQLAQLIGATRNFVTYDYNNENYQAKFGFIPKEKGLFVFTLTSSAKGRTYVKTHSGCKCLLENYATYYPLNNKADGNYHLYQLAEDPILQGDTEEMYYRVGNYTFYVVE